MNPNPFLSPDIELMRMEPSQRKRLMTKVNQVAKVLMEPGRLEFRNQILRTAMVQVAEAEMFTAIDLMTYEDVLRGMEQHVEQCAKYMQGFEAVEEGSQ